MHLPCQWETSSVTTIVAPSLDQLLESDEPAWLWDSARARIAWANQAGTDWFGAQTLFDLIDMVFDSNDESVATIRKLGARLPRGQSETIQFGLGAKSNNLPTGFIACDCYVHALADGRSGLLVCAQKQPDTPNALPSAMQAMALGAFPMAMAVVSGSGSIRFSNEAMHDLLLHPMDLAFTDQLVEQSYSGGTSSGICHTKTPLGMRDLRVIVRLLENGERLADASFIVVIEDVTERRALEKTLMTSQLPQNGNDEKTGSASSQPAHINVAETLSHLKREIETQTALADKSISQKTENKQANNEATSDLTENLTDKQNNDDAPLQKKATDSVSTSPEHDEFVGRVPEIVQKTLNDLPQPLVLISHEGEILFANDTTVKLLGAEHWRDLGEMTTLGDALTILEGEDGEISLFTLQDEPINLDVFMTSFPWKDGAVYQATLSPNDDGESADNRRNENRDTKAVKKNTEIDEAASGKSEPGRMSLASSLDNVVSLHPHDDNNDAGISRNDSNNNGSCNPDDADLRAILDTATDGIITLDSKGKICSFSAGAEALFGYNANEVTGTPLKKLLVRGSRKTLTQYIAALNGDGLAAVFNDGREVTARVKQGGEISLFVTIGKMVNKRLNAGVSQDGKAAFCAVVRDITQWKKTEAELRSAKEEAEQSSERKSNFLANISHELRTPLNAIMGFSEVMLSERFGEIKNEKYLSYANDIHTSGEHLLSLINDLLDLSKVEAGKLELNFTSVNLLNEVDEAIHTLQSQADEKRVLLSKALKGGLPNVVADLRSIKQVLLNILSNAIKFTESGGQVVVSVKLDDTGEMILSIKDTGRGMSASELKRALEPFQQIEGANDGTNPGTGLGLPLTKALVEANRAKFSIISAPKKGTLVEVVFPTTRVLAD